MIHTFLKQSTSFDSIDDTSETIHSIGLWDLGLPDNQTFIILFLWLVGFIVLFKMFYRILLKNQVRQGVEPRVLSNTLRLGGTGAFLLIMFLTLYHPATPLIGPGWFVGIGSVYLAVVLGMISVGRALFWLLPEVGVIAVIIALRLVNLVI